MRTVSRNIEAGNEQAFAESERMQRLSDMPPASRV